MTLPKRVRLALVLVPLCAGCMAWESQQLPQPSSTQRLPDPVRITRTDRSTLVLNDPMVVGDSIVGFAGRERTAVALRDVWNMERSKTQFVRTAGLSFALTIAAVAVLVAVTLTSVASE